MAQENGLLGAVAAVGGAIGKAVGEVFAAEKQLGGTMAGGPASSQQFKVTKETVLQAGKLINNQVAELREAYRGAFRDLRVDPRGLDDLNREIAEAWNDRLVENDDSYANNVERYIKSLGGLVDQLRAAAKQYGHTDEDIQAAMGAAGASRD
ncbi:hypothetical protein [Saccharothrix syringae]|uniref:hypothetical protein n=1 Tax=Saccharothrix syringae TaxID=103733 RepID=UPI0005258D43|nr:hypothetical protein [Saccharothrix syringae]